MSLADRKARDRALAPEASILLQAPAGSGKTEVLTQRFLSLLARVDEPEEILALTFTRKAAAEMRERILKVLDGDIDPRKPTASTLQALREAVLARSSQRDWDRVELRSRLRIQTIDSLNHEIARALPLLGGGPPTLNVTDDASALHLAAARLTLRDAETDPRYQAAVDLVLRRLDNQWARAEALLAGMLARRSQWLRTLMTHDSAVLPDIVQAGIAALVLEAIESAQARLPAALRGRFEALLPKVAGWRAEKAGGDEAALGQWLRWLAPAARLEADAARLEEWSALAELLLTQKGEWRKSLTVRDGLPPKQKDAKDEALALIEACARIPGLRERLAALVRLPPVALGAEERAALSAL
ncbi:MAG: UvrD-helicase domain-containing protein, partial [Steroidobacteraceae bacterium]